MATLIFSALGRAVGGRVGGAIGALAGRAIDGMLLSPGTHEGPRLQDLAVTASSYGEPIPRHFGRMRVGGTIIWATELRESAATRGGGKGRPAQTTYSYTASFAVALSSRPLGGIGRIWADGSLLRGAAGDLKPGGRMRFHAGHGDQLPDPLLAAAEGAGVCPAFRGLAYVVFEDLPLGDFGNRLPVLSFEVFGPETALDLATILGADGGAGHPPVEASVPLAGIAGLSLAGPLSETLALVGALVPFGCAMANGQLSLVGGATEPLLLPEPVATGGPAGAAEQGAPGVVRKRDLSRPARLGAVQYFDVERDYQTGLQRVPGRPAEGQPRVLQAPFALTSADARNLVEAAARREAWSCQSLVWRTAVVDPALGPGALVRVPGEGGVWRLSDWEWQASGVELTLSRVPAVNLAAGPVDAANADAGRAVTAPDLVNGPTELTAFELPWDEGAASAAGHIYVAASSAAAGWAGAALYLVDPADGLRSAGSSGRIAATVGHTLGVLPEATTLIPDRTSRVIVQLLSPDMVLSDANGPRLAGGANRALLGEEIVQFARAEPLGQGRWRLSGLLRGRGGTEAATAGHGSGEAFVLLDAALSVIAGGGPETTRIAAIGLADPEPVIARVGLHGIARRPLAPVHAAVRRQADGALVLRWTRRARGAWTWADEAEVPLHEEAERYEVLVGSEAEPVAAWQVTEPRLTIPPETVRTLRAARPGAPVLVRQQGSYAVSQSTLITNLA